MQFLDVISVNVWAILASLANLLLLTWIIKRFLFKPVKKMMDARRAAIDEDYAQAKVFFEKAIEEGDIEAYCDLGTLYFKGNGVEQDYKRAFELYQKEQKQEILIVWTILVCATSGGMVLKLTFRSRLTTPRKQLRPVLKEPCMTQD